MKKDFSLQEKVIWRDTAGRGLDEIFYPSIYKDLLKKQSFFEENFSWEVVEANEDNIKNIFLPIYKEEIAIRENYTLKGKDISGEIIDKINNNIGGYNLIFVKNKKGELLGATLFSIKEKTFSMAYRAFRKKIDDIPKGGATLDYWNEKKIRDFISTQKYLDIFSHGRDTHPYIGKRIGLALYKLKVGTRPVQAFDKDSREILEYKTFSEDFFIDKKEPVLFFCNPDSEGFHRTCVLYSLEDFLKPSFINEFKKVLEWTNIDFKYVGY